MFSYSWMTGLTSMRPKRSTPWGFGQVVEIVIRVHGTSSWKVRSLA